MNMFIKRALVFLPCIMLFERADAMESKTQKVTTRDILEALQSLDLQLNEATKETKQKMWQAVEMLNGVEKMMEELKAGPKPYSVAKPYEEAEKARKGNQTFTFKNLAGKIPVSVTEITDFIKNVEKYKAIGASMPRGILLVGPSGTGKTSIAKAIAGEADASFFDCCATSFVQGIVGYGARNVRDLFNRARESVKSGAYKKAIIFIDEIDAVGATRRTMGGGADTEYRQTLNELLNQLDGFKADDSVFVLAATNRLQDLDKALIRAGRFDRTVEIMLPDEEDRIAILKLYLAQIKASKDIDVAAIAQLALGKSGAELKNIVNEAAIRAIREMRAEATQADFSAVLQPASKKKEQSPSYFM